MAVYNGTQVAIPKPDGYVLNFENPPQDGVVEIAAVYAVENILAALFLFQRLYTRIFLMGKFQIEDVTVIIAWVTSLATQSILLHLYVVKAVGVHAYEMPIERYEYFTKVLFAATLIYSGTTASSKATLCLFYRRLSPVKTFQHGVWATLFVCVGSSAGIFLSLLFGCKPIQASWDPLLAATADCVNKGSVYVATAAIGILTDVILLALPVPTVIGLQIRMRQKVGLLALFAVGSITLITSVVRLIILLPSLTDLDQTYVLTSGTLWICIEANLLVMCCCLPTLRTFFKHVAPSLIGEKSTTTGTNDKSKSTPQYALRTFGGGAGAGGTSGGTGVGGGKSRAMDSIMRTQGERLDDKDDDDCYNRFDRRSDDDNGSDDFEDYHNRYRHTARIRGGADSRSHDSGSGEVVRKDYESDEAILNSKTVTVNVTYEDASPSPRDGRTRM